MRTSAWLLPLSLFALASAMPLSGCSSNKNHAEREATPEAIADAAADPATLDQEGRKKACLGVRPPLLDAAGQPSCPDNDGGPVECLKQEQPESFEYYWAWDLDHQTLPPTRALGTYVYDDRTTEFLVPPRDQWEPTADPVTRCFETPNNFAVRFKGGPFINYGGGFGKSFCVTPDACSGLPMPQSQEFPGEALDLSDWGGIAIWARRGPEGTALLRVGISEKHSAEDLNTGTMDNPEREGRLCKRYRLCGCPAGTPCSPRMDGDEYCFDPAVDKEPDGVTVKGQTCGKKHCDVANTTTTLADPLFGGRACANAVQSDGLTALFCYNPGEDPNPPAKRERCGNPFVYPVNISTKWQLIKVPFSELRQSDEADVANDFDLKSVRQIIFTHSTGSIDFYIGDVGFYRHKPPSNITPI